MPKNASNTWVGNTFQPQAQTYQTAGMLQPAVGPQPPAPTPTPTPTPTTPPPGTGGSGPPPVGPPAYAIPPVPQTQPPIFPQPPSSGEPDRDRLINAMVANGLTTQEY